MTLPPAPFIGRQRELAVLQELAASGKPELFVLYGRRRVGKTELLQQLCRGRRAAYFLAAQVRDKDNLRAFRKVLEEALGDPLLGQIDFPDWDAALAYVAERAGDERLILVLDEFPYLCESNPGLPSLVQRFWDQRGKRSRLMLVLCGSQVSFMEKEVLAERSPLFGRRTGQRRLEPLLPSEALGFFPGWERTLALTAYGILGGMPAYLGRFDPGRTLEESLLAEVLRPEGYLFDEVHYLLHTELTNPSTYASILAAVARGAEKVGDVALAVGVDSPTANKYLHVLRELRLVEREVPLTDPDPLRSRRGVYRISDRFVAFHFRHVQPHASSIEAGRGARVLAEFVRPDLPRLLAESEGELLLERLRHEGAELVGEELADVGRHSGRAVRALARTVSGRGVAVVARGAASADVAAELAELKPAFGTRLVQLVASGGAPGEPALAVR
jgi:AAA+ ATPase superfamily predicted ATPase